MAVALSSSDQRPSPGNERLQSGASTAGTLLGALLKDQVHAGCSHRSFREKYLNKALDECKSMYSCDIRGHHGCVNALAFSKGQEQFLASGGDDKRVLVWRVADMVSKPKGPRSMCMDNRHTSNIFTLDFSCDNSYIFSGGEDKEVLMHDFKTGYTINRYEHLDAVYCVAANPASPDMVYTASEDGCVYIIDSRVARGQLGHDMVLCESPNSYQCVAVNPVEPVLLAVSNARTGSSLYDLRMKKMVIQYECRRIVVSRHNGVSVAFDSTGSRLYSMYRQRPPTLHNLFDPYPICYFSDCTGHYKNTVTMKSGCFMGRDDEFVVSGSDDFGVYIWKVPSSEELEAARKTLNKEDVCAILYHRSPRMGSLEQSSPHFVFPGHRSIVNQARYSPANRILVTSGVEKIVKVWSDLPIHSGHTLHQSGAPPARQRFSPSELRSILLGVSYSEPADPTEEDVKVLALFDNLMDDVAYSDSSDESLFASSMDDDDGDLLNPFMRNRRYILSASSDSDSLHSIGYSEDWDSFSDDWDTGSSSGQEEANESRLFSDFNNESGPPGDMVDREEEEEGTGEDEDSTEEETSLEEESSMEDEDAMNRVDMFVSHFIRAVTTAMRDSGGSPALGGHGAGRVGECEDSSGDVISDSSCDDHLPTEPVDAGCISNDAGGSANSVPGNNNESLLSDTLALNDDVVKGNADNLPSSLADSNVKKGAKAQSKRRERAKASAIVSDGKEGASVVTTKVVEAKNSKSKRTGFTSVMQAAGGGGGGERGKQSKSGESLAVDQDQDSGMRLRTREISRSTRSKCGQRKASSRNESASCSGISDGACGLDRPPGPSPCDSCEVELPGADGREKEVGTIITPLDGEDEGDVNNRHYCTRSKRKKIVDARAISGGLQDRYSADDFLRASSPNGSSEMIRGKESERSGRKKGKDSDAGNSNR